MNNTALLLVFHRSFFRRYAKNSGEPRVLQSPDIWSVIYSNLPGGVSYLSWYRANSTGVKKIWIFICKMNTHSVQFSLIYWKNAVHEEFFTAEKHDYVTQTNWFYQIPGCTESMEKFAAALFKRFSRMTGSWFFMYPRYLT